MCLHGFDEISESHVYERRNREFIHQLRDLASQSDWTLRYPSARFPTSVQKIHEVDGETTLSTWSRHLKGLTRTSRALVDAIRDDSGFAIADFIVAGSLGKDTAVEHFSTDVDLLVVFKNFDPSRYSKYLEFIENALLQSSNAGDLKLMRKTFPAHMMGSKKSSPARLAEVGDEDIRHGEAKYLRVLWKGGEVTEILPGGVMTDISTVTSDADRELWGTWCENFAYSPWSASCTEFSVEFVGNQPAHVLIAIRALKEWRNALKINKPQLTVSSFALELLAIAANEDQYNATSRDVFVGVLRVLCRPDHLINVFWTVYYARESIPQDILDQRPLVLDPAKQWNNTVQTSNLTTVRPFARQALEALGCSVPIAPVPISPRSVTAAAC